MRMTLKETIDGFIELFPNLRDHKIALEAHLSRATTKDNVTYEYIFNSYKRYYDYWNIMYKNVQPNFIRKDEKLKEPIEYIYNALYLEAMITIKLNDNTLYLFNNNIKELIKQYNKIFNKKFSL